MKIYFFASVMLMFYVCCIPVKAAFVLRISPKPGFGAGLALFENRFALRKAGKRMQGEKKHLPWKKAGLDAEKLAAYAALHRMLRHGLRKVKLEQVFLRGCIGTGDAASTALLFGTVQALENTLECLLPPEKLDFRYYPDFANGSDFDLGGMVSLTIGHIMVTALIGALDYAKRRLRIWKKNIRSKISCVPRWKTSATWWMWTL